MKHTPTPWSIDGSFIVNQSEVICQFFNKHEEDFPKFAENAQRIVECVNACDGINHPQTLASQNFLLGEVNKQLQKENKELRNEISKLIGMVPPNPEYRIELQE